MQQIIPISEIFYSIQGEGQRAGYPAVFVRTALCNFKCAGFGCEYTTPDGEKKHGCDSFFSVDKAFKSEWEYYDDFLELVDIIDSKIPTGSKHNLNKPDIIITGGEPLLHWGNDVFQRLISHYITRGHKVTIETNASINIAFTKRYQNEILFSMSVKLANSGESLQKRMNIENVTNILEHSPNSFFKFVINKDTWDEDYQEIRQFLKDIPVYVNNIYLMPMGENIEEIEKNAKFVFEKAMELRFCYSDRQHIRIFNDQRGV